MAKVGIVMGSDSDMPVMAKAADILEQLGIDYEMTIISAHREPDVFFEYPVVSSSSQLLHHTTPSNLKKIHCYFSLLFQSSLFWQPVFHQNIR